MDDVVKCKICVGVDHKGNWVCGGGIGVEPDEAFGWIIDTLEPGEARYVVEVSLKKPIREVVIADESSITVASKGTS